jgi:hypothetical protein
MSRNATRRSLRGKRLTSFGVVRRPKPTTTTTIVSHTESYTLDHDELAREIRRRLELAQNRSED